MKKGNLSKLLRRDKSIEPQLCLQWRSVGDGEPGVFQWIGRHILQSLPRTRREGISVFDRVGFVRSRRETNFHRSTFRNPNGLETGHHRTGRIPWSRRRRCPCETIGGFLDQNSDSIESGSAPVSTAWLLIAMQTDIGIDDGAVLNGDHRSGRSRIKVHCIRRGSLEQTLFDRRQCNLK